MSVAEAHTVVMTAQDILKLLPHRFPFLMIDRVVELEPGKRAVGIKNVTINEPFFQGHFPELPIMPGVLVQEALAQLAAVVAMHQMGSTSVMLLGVDKYRIRRPVYPGDQLRLEVWIMKVKGAFWRFGGKASVDGAEVADGEFLAALGMDPKGKTDTGAGA